MNDDINDVLAKKRAWKKGDIDRRQKDGSRADRKNLAEVYRAGRESEKRIRVEEKKSEHSAFVLAVCLVLGLMILIFWSKSGHTEEIPSVEVIASAIWQAEGGNRTSHPYGILSHYHHTTAHQACINTIRHRLRQWNRRGDFIVFLGETYSPPRINPNWVRLVKYFLSKEKNQNEKL